MGDGSFDISVLVFSSNLPTAAGPRKPIALLDGSEGKRRDGAEARYVMDYTVQVSYASCIHGLIAGGKRNVERLTYRTHHRNRSKTRNKVASGTKSVNIVDDYANSRPTEKIEKRQ
jgi:hypothetical protein